MTSGPSSRTRRRFVEGCRWNAISRRAAGVVSDMASRQSPSGASGDCSRPRTRRQAAHATDSRANLDLRLNPARKSMVQSSQGPPMTRSASVLACGRLRCAQANPLDLQESAMDRIWLENYPPGVPREIDARAYASLVDLFLKVCARFRDRPAFSSMGNVLTYGEVERKTRDFAAFLQKERGLAVGDRLAVMMPNVLQYPVAL